MNEAIVGRSTKPLHKRTWARILVGCVGAIVAVVLVLALVPAPSIWGRPQPVDETNGGGLQSLSCSSASFCATFDWSGRLFTWDGVRWHQMKASLVQNLKEPLDVSCGATNFCLVGNDAGEMFRIDGTSVVKFTLDPSGGQLSSVSCASQSFCATVDGGAAYVLRAGKWSKYVVEEPADGGTLNTISCVGPSFCAAGGDNGVATFDGHSWSFAQLPLTGADSVAQLSCSRVSVCVGITGDGNWLRYEHGSWRLMGGFGGGNQTQGYTPKMLCAPRCRLATRLLQAASCQLHNNRWSRLGYLARESLGRRFLEGLSDSAISISCPSPSFCAAVDGGGNAYFERT